MRKIIKEPEPEFWRDFKKKYPKKTYNDLGKSEEGKELRKKIRDFMIKNQRGLCCYCCKSIASDNSHNEHIKPRSVFPELSMEYQNIVVSCNTPSGKEPSCGHAKCNKYNENLFVSPLDDDCESHFKYKNCGKDGIRIEGKTPKGEYTEILLNLNSYDLRQARRALLKQCEKDAKQGKELLHEWHIAESKDGTLPRFVDMVRYFYNDGYFDFDLDGKDD